MDDKRHENERGESLDPATPAFWRSRWRAGETGWDQGGPHPALTRLLDVAQNAGLLPVGARILEPGCGRAHSGAALARLGYEVLSFDVTEEAIAAAQKLYGDVSGLKLAIQDALTVNPEWQGRFNGIFDRAMMCALPPELRRSYARAAHTYLMPGGVFLSVVITERADGRQDGPPFSVPLKALTDMMAPGFTQLWSEEYTLPPGDKASRELLSVWRRRDHWREDQDA